MVDRIELLTAGYVRKAEQALCADIVIPPEIIHVIRTFYPVLLTVGFDPEKCAKSISISGEHNQTITQKTCTTASVYHPQWIDSCLCAKVSFKIDVSKVQHFGNLILGFVTDDSVIDWGFAFDSQYPSYAICLDGEKRIDGVRPKGSYDRIKTKRHSKVMFTLDLVEENIKMTVDEEEIMCFEKISKGDDIRYKFGVCFWVSTEGEAVTLKDVIETY